MTDEQSEQSDGKLKSVAFLAEAPPLGHTPHPAQGQRVRAHHENSELYLQFSEFHEQYVSHYIELADAKAGATFAVVTGMLGYLLSKQNIGSVLTKPEFSTGYFQVLLPLALLAIAGALSFLVVAPRLSTTQDDSFVFWGTVARFSSSREFLKKVTETDSAGMITARLTHCYDMSRVCEAKYRWLRRAMALALIGVATGLILILKS